MVVVIVSLPLVYFSFTNSIIEACEWLLLLYLWFIFHLLILLLKEMLELNVHIGCLAFLWTFKIHSVIADGTFFVVQSLN